MTHPYRTAPLVAPQRPWWRRLLCAVGRHSLYLVQSHDMREVAVCEHCNARRDPLSLSVAGYVDTLMHERSELRGWARTRRDAIARRFLIHRQ